MASVKLADVIDVDIYRALTSENNPERTAFFESGVVMRSPLMDSFATEDSALVNLPFWRDLDPTDEPNYSDDSDTDAVPNKIVQGQLAAKRASLNNAWAVKDLVNELTMGDLAMERVKARTSQYWMWQWQRRLIAMTIGIFNANVANSITSGFGSTGDMVHDISTDDTNGTPITDEHLFDNDAFTEARFTLGDHVDDLAAILVHSTVRKRMQKQDAIEYIQDSKLGKVLEFYQGHRLITDDSAPVIPVTAGAGFRYITVLYGPSAFGYGEGSPSNPVEIWRNPASGNGGGEEQLWERKTWMLHPWGHSNLDATNTAAESSGGAGDGLWQTIADCKLAANWRRTHFRKNVPITFLVTNG